MKNILINGTLASIIALTSAISIAQERNINPNEEREGIYNPDRDDKRTKNNNSINENKGRNLDNETDRVGETDFMGTTGADIDRDRAKDMDPNKGINR